MKRIVLIAAFYIFGKELFRALHVANDVTQVGDLYLRHIGLLQDVGWNLSALVPRHRLFSGPWRIL